MRKYVIVVLVLSSILFMSGESHAIRLGSFEVNPFLGVSEQYSDNVFNTNADRVSDFSTVVTPGAQIIFPRVKKKYRLELIYKADFEIFNKTASLNNAVDQKASAKFESQFPSGIELHLGEEFIRNHDPRGTNIGLELDFFRSNLASSSIAYVLSDRFAARLDYSNYILNYEAARNDFRNRMDNSVAGYLYYRLRPKTSAFIEYEFVLIDYRTDNELNSKEHHIMAGLTWDVTGKTKGTVKGGYGIKNFADPTLSGYKGFIMELVIDHNFTPRHSLKLKGIRSTQETNVIGSDFFVTTGFSAEYSHRLTGKITAKALVAYGRDSFSGVSSRRDNTWEISPWLYYQVRKWLRAELGYSYTTRSSNVEEFSYRNNTYYLKLVATL
ncbi:MAG: outer membrane beta-barrel protein [Nitrospirae bacterium]|nr:outer membrane beta-barrel protein [Nitrospirota bacterium]